MFRNAMQMVQKTEHAIVKISYDISSDAGRRVMRPCAVCEACVSHSEIKQDS